MRPALLVAFACLATALAAPPVFAQGFGLSGLLAQGGFGRPDLVHRLSPDEARESAQSGRQLPLDALLPRIRGQVGEGQVLSTELEDRRGRRIYVLRWKSATRLMDLEVDAATGQVLKAE